MGCFADHGRHSSERSGQHPLRLLSSVVRYGTLRLILAWAIALSTGTPPRAFGQPPTDEGVEQIERRIRRQKEENLQAVRSLIARLTSQLDEQRAGLAKDVARLRAAGGSFDFDPALDLPPIEAKAQAQRPGTPPRPSPAIPPPPRRTEATLPPLPSGSRNPFNTDFGP